LLARREDSAGVSEARGRRAGGVVVEEGSGRAEMRTMGKRSRESTE